MAPGNLPLPSWTQPPVEPAKSVFSLRSRGSALALPESQRQLLSQVDLSRLPSGGDFEAALRATGWAGLHTAAVEILQINMGKLCNMTCRHCHVDAGPDRTGEMMSRETARLCLEAAARTGAHTVDITGGAPELNPNFRYLVDGAVNLGKHVIDRCNLTVLLVPALKDLPEWFAGRGVEIVCSLPHWRKRNTDSQRGDGTYEKSIEVLHRLNAVGYGQGDPKRTLTLVANPAGAFLPGNQAAMEREWRGGLLREHGLRFDRLLVLNNMPISRFLEWLEKSGNLERYMELLVTSFNAATITGLMCRNTLSVSWDGRIFDCDFNQMLDLAACAHSGTPLHITSLEDQSLQNRPITTGRHCFGCTAGAGSSCGGALEG